MTEARCECGAHWRSRRYAHCSLCHRTFAGVTTFDRHQRHGRCRVDDLVERDQVWHAPQRGDRPPNWV